MSTANTRPTAAGNWKTNEEPELGSEESVPLDGTDPIGEKMIDELGRERASSKEPSKEDDGPADGEPMPEQFPAS